MTVRALRADDRDKVARAVRGLGRESIYYRLFSHRSELTEAGLDRIMRFDAEREVVLIVTRGSGAEETVIGSARYVVLSPESADVAFMVEEDFHGQGIASRLLRHLATVAPTRASRPSRPTCSPTTARCAASSRAPAGRCRRGARAVRVHLALTLPDRAAP